MKLKGLSMKTLHWVWNWTASTSWWRTQFLHKWKLAYKKRSLGEETLSLGHFALPYCLQNVNSGMYYEDLHTRIISWFCFLLSMKPLVRSLSVPETSTKGSGSTHKTRAAQKRLYESSVIKNKRGKSTLPRWPLHIPPRPMLVCYSPRVRSVFYTPYCIPQIKVEYARVH